MQFRGVLTCEQVVKVSWRTAAAAQANERTSTAQLCRWPNPATSTRSTRALPARPIIHQSSSSSSSAAAAYQSAGRVGWRHTAVLGWYFLATLPCALLLLTNWLCPGHWPHLAAAYVSQLSLYRLLQHLGLLICFHSTFLADHIMNFNPRCVDTYFTSRLHHVCMYYIIQ